MGHTQILYIPSIPGHLKMQYLAQGIGLGHGFKMNDGGGSFPNSIHSPHSWSGISKIGYIANGFALCSWMKI